MINYIIYGHTSYLDVLRVQTDYVSIYDNTTLFINTNDVDMDDVYGQYKRVVFYDDTQPYAKRLIDCISQIDDEYFLMIHDIDILIDVDEEIIRQFYKFMKDNGVDRVDLKQSPNLNTEQVIRFDKSNIVSEWETMKPTEITDGSYLVKQIRPEDYIYNVNPSIWNRESFLGLLNTFPNKTYRNIEGMDVQEYISNLLVYKLFTNKPVNCGYFQCLGIFKYLHISHSGKLLLLNDKYETEYGQSYDDISDEYVSIVTKYNLKFSNKWVK